MDLFSTITSVEFIKTEAKWQAGYVPFNVEFCSSAFYIKQFFLGSDMCIINPTEFRLNILS